MNTKQILISILSFIELAAVSQIGIGTTTPHTSSIVEISSTNKGFLPPRLTHAQRESLQNPAEGLFIYCTNCCVTGTPSLYNGTTWRNLIDCSATDADDDAIPNYIDIDDDNDGIPDTEEFLKLDFTNYSNIPAGLSYSSKRGFRITDATGQYALDVYDSFDEFQPETSHPAQFSTSTGSIKRNSSHSNYNSNKRAYAVITWTTENSPIAWEFESIILKNIESLSNNTSSSCDAYAFENSAEWSYLPTSTAVGVILSVDPSKTNKVGSFLTEDPDASSIQKPHTNSQIGTDPSFEPAYTKSNGTIKQVVLNLFDEEDNHSVKANFPERLTKTHLHIWDAAENNSMSWEFIANTSSFIEKDSDNDGIPNHLDLDSDNDGCYDAVESGSASAAGQNSYVSATGRLTNNVGANGLHQNVENSDNQTTLTNYSINPDYLNKNIHSACP